jgi:hypothetical protein
MEIPNGAHHWWRQVWNPESILLFYLQLFRHGRDDSPGLTTFMQERISFILDIKTGVDSRG